MDLTITVSISFPGVALSYVLWHTIHLCSTQGPLHGMQKINPDTHRRLTPS